MLSCKLFQSGETLRQNQLGSDIDIDLLPES